MKKKSLKLLLICASLSLVGCQNSDVKDNITTKATESIVEIEEIPKITESEELDDYEELYEEMYRAWHIFYRFGMYSMLDERIDTVDRYEYVPVEIKRKGEIIYIYEHFNRVLMIGGAVTELKNGIAIIDDIEHKCVYIKSDGSVYEHDLPPGAFTNISYVDGDRYYAISSNALVIYDYMSGEYEVKKDLGFVGERVSSFHSIYSNGQGYTFTGSISIAEASPSIPCYGFLDEEFNIVEVWKASDEVQVGLIPDYHFIHGDRCDYIVTPDRKKVYRIDNNGRNRREINTSIALAYDKMAYDDKVMYGIENDRNGNRYGYIADVIGDSLTIRKRLIVGESQLIDACINEQTNKLYMTFLEAGENIIKIIDIGDEYEKDK